MIRSRSQVGMETLGWLVLMIYELSPIPTIIFFWISSIANVSINVLYSPGHTTNNLVKQTEWCHLHFGSTSRLDNVFTGGRSSTLGRCGSGLSSNIQHPRLCSSVCLWLQGGCGLIASFKATCSFLLLGPRSYHTTVMMVQSLDAELKRRWCLSVGLL